MGGAEMMGQEQEGLELIEKGEYKCPGEGGGR